MHAFDLNDIMFFIKGHKSLMAYWYPVPVARSYNK